MAMDLVQAYAADLTLFENLYRKLHIDPELSLCEEVTAATVAQHLRSLDGFEVKTGIGGHGVVGILRNGTGKAVLLRAELDALPVAELTGLPYASAKVMQHPKTGLDTAVMHACGHDLHMCAQLAAAAALHASRHLWSGTLIALFQGDEENATGARSMVEDGLYSPDKHNVPIPDVALGGHCMPLRAGLIKTRYGVINAVSYNYKITVIGRGGHAARPHTTADPVIIACNIVTKLQQIVSRQINPLLPAVLTVGSLHTGTAANIVPDKAVIEINLRAFDRQVMTRMVDSMKSIVNLEAEIHGAPEPPRVEQTVHFPLLENDVKCTEIVAERMRSFFGSDFDTDAIASTGSEDFAALQTPAGNLPFVFWNYGCLDPATWDKALKDGTLDKIPGNHSPYFAPAIQPSLKVGMEAYCIGALAFLEHQ